MNVLRFAEGVAELDAQADQAVAGFRRVTLGIEEDELVEVTPKSIRLRKAILDPHDRKRSERAKTAAA